VPVSGRTRFNCYSEAQVNEVSDMQANRVIYEVEHSGGRFLPDYDPRYATHRSLGMSGPPIDRIYRTLLVKRVMRRLIPVSGMADEEWEIRVIDDPKTANAFVLPGGKVFVFSGILPITRNESGLAAVLGHEISHNLCEHFAERMSQDLIQGIFTNSAAFLAAGIGAFVIVQMLGGRLMNLAFGNPMSRKQESEADFVGLMMMAEACYDPREALGFWVRGCTFKITLSSKQAC
jgi:metalloendopeptidase OMA1, mitochondrial